jgi:nitrogen fixation/metabolism regulation signal transduction histidine kinase
MSQAQAHAPAPPSVRGTYRRSFRNYLLDRNFQLKYTGFLMGTALGLSVALGAVLWRTSNEAIKEGKKTVERGQLVILQSRRVSQVVAMNIAKEYKDDPELAKTFGEEAAKDEQKLKDEQDRLVRDAVFLEHQQKELLVGLVAALGLLVVGVGLLGIVFTHKVAGPIYKMKRLLREVGGGKLVVRERLRKGDELHHFFEVFETMVAELRRRQEAEIAKVDEILAKLSDAPVSQRGLKEFDEDGVALLQKLRREMQEQLDA